MKRLFLLIIFMLGFVLADSPIPGNAYVISALGIKNTSDVVSYVSGDTSVSGNANYVLAPQVIVYQDSLEYVGSYTPFTGCLSSQHYTNGAPDGMCITGIIDDLTTGGTDKALSAEQGKVLNDKISSLQSATTINLMNLWFARYDTDGLTITDNQNGTITINGTSTSDKALIDLYDYYDLSVFQKSVTYKYFLANEPVDGTLLQMWVYSNGEWAMWKSSSTEILFQIQDNWDVIKFRYFIGANKTFNNSIIKPMITSNLDATSQNYSPNPLYDIPKIIQVEPCYDGVTIDYQFVLHYQNKEFGIIYFTAARDIPRWNHIIKGLGSGTQRDFYEQTGTYTFQRHKTNTIQTGYGGLPAGSYVITF